MEPGKCFSSILLLIGISYAFPQSGVKFDNFIKDTFHNITEGHQSHSETEPPPIKYRSCGNGKICVPRNLCKNDEIVTTGERIFEERGEFECEFLHLCCEVPKKNITTSASNICGQRSTQGVILRITGDSADNESEFGEYPWMVAIMRAIPDPEGGTTNHYECGGSLITPTVIVSAAHRLRKFSANTLIARAGEWDIKSKNEILPAQNRQVNEIILHENFDRASLHNDIALLVVDSPFEYAQHISPICLPPPNANFDNSRCYATGWGKDKFGRDTISQGILREVHLPIVPRNQCQIKLRATRLSEFFNLDESFICAGGEAGKDTCQGDGGSPLVCPIEGENNQFYLAGIVAWGLGCGEENIPGVYANVTYLRPWINEKLRYLGIIDFNNFTA